MIANANPDNKKSLYRLDISDLGVSRSDIPIFSPINLQLTAGQSLQISGGNGAGKTTLLRAICGLCRSHEGKIEWNGQSIDHEYSTQQDSFYQQLLYLGHSIGLKSKLTVEQNLNFYRQLRFPSNPELIKSAIQDLAIAHYFDEPVERLSAGQKRRVALCRLLTEPVSLWILDEPLVALDKEGQDWLINLCNQHLSDAGMLIITSHQPITGIQGLQNLVLS